MATLAKLLATLPKSPSARGRAFERICKWYLENQPMYAGLLRKVWLWEEWPGRWGQDMGIDLVAETNQGQLWAIQAKGYSPTSTITKRDVDSFLSESARDLFSFRLLLASTDQVGPNARQVFAGQTIPASCQLLSDLVDEPIEWPASVDDLRAARRPIAVPRPHQAKALQAIAERLPMSERGRVIMACGTGKTLVQLWSHERLASHRTLVVVPSLVLLQQTLREWTANRTHDFDFLVVCSDETVAENDSFATEVTTIGTPVTTEPAKVRTFLATAGRQVIFSTYHSSPVIAQAIAGSEFRFDLIVADEAHRLAGAASREFATVLRDDAIPAQRRLFFTATPRYLSGRLRTESGEQDFEVASMDDEALFGRELYRLSFGEAIRDGLLSDYQVLVVGVTDRQVHQLAQDAALVNVAGKTWDARSLARLLGVAKAMRDHGLRRVLSFHNRVKAAETFVANLRALLPYLPATQTPQGRPHYLHVSGMMPVGKRRSKLDEFRNVEDDGHALLANARCFSEGVDVPAIDCVAFAEPRRSQIEIVQIVGRAIRLSPDKTLGTIMIPVLVVDGASAQQVLTDSSFRSVWEVVRALRDHDDDLAEQLDEARRKLGRERHLGASELPRKIILDLPATIGRQFLEAFTTRVVQQTTSPWEEGFAAATDFATSQGHARVPLLYVTGSGYALGTWVSKQRNAYDRRVLSTQRITRLESLPDWSWKPFELQWETNFADLATFVRREGHSRVPSAFNTDEGFALGRWVASQRVAHSKHVLSLEREARLEALPAWTWAPVSNRWDEAFLQLSALVKQRGHARLSHKYKTDDGVALGAWITNQRTRHAAGRLSVSRAARLETLAGWTWDAHEDNWDAGLSALREFAARQGDALVPVKHKTPEGFALGIWVGTQRRIYGKSKLSAARIARLEALDGWAWDPIDSTWERSFIRVEAYVEREGHSRVPHYYKEPSGLYLGRWVGHQRDARSKGELNVERQARLETLPGWTWDRVAERWESGFSRLTEFGLRHGHTRVPQHFKCSDSFPLGTWVSRQRVARAKGELNESRVARFTKLPDFSWDALGDQWQVAYEQLLKYIERERNALVPAFYKDEDDFALGSWVTSQRVAFGKGELRDDRVQRLAALAGWQWTPHVTLWKAGFARLQEYVLQHGHAGIPAKYKTRDGFTLGAWAVKQRTAYLQRSLGADSIGQLESLPRWCWDPLEAQWEQGYSLARAYVEREGHCRVPQDFKTTNDFALGTWVSNQRKARDKGVLTDDRLAQLESLKGWCWVPHEDRWESTFAELLAFVQREGHARVPALFRTVDQLTLGLWCSRQRRLHHDHMLDADRKARLEALPGWSWEPTEEQWGAYYASLQLFVAQEGHARVPKKLVSDDGLRVGLWATTQRTLYGKGGLSRERVARLEALTGWTWDPLADRWELGFAYLVEFARQVGHARVVEGFKAADGFALGTWVANQRQAQRTGRLPTTSASRLEALPQWRWAGSGKRAEPRRAEFEKSGQGRLPWILGERASPNGESNDA